jgi:hypothetical protein
MKAVSALVLAVIMLAGAPARAAEFGLGMDLIRLIDQNQDEGMDNLWFQFATSGNGAVLLGYASGDTLTVLDVAYKHYLGGRLDSVFFQAGAGYYDNDVTDDLGFVGALGYERKLAKHFTIGGSVKLIAGVDEVLLNTVETPVFQPTLSVALVF